MPDAEIDEIGHADPTQPLEPAAQTGQEARHAEPGDGELHDHGGAGAGNGDEAVAGAMGHAVRDDERDVRPRDQHQDDDGEDEAEIELRVDHRWAIAGDAMRGVPGRSMLAHGGPTKLSMTVT